MRMRMRWIIALGLGAGILLGAASFAGKKAGAAGLHSSLLEKAPRSARSRANPYAGNSDAVLAGRKLFRRHCGACHGEESRGTDWAPSLRSSRIRSTPPGVLVWFLKNGDLRAGMPSWSQLPDERRWQIVTYLQAKP